MEGRDIYSGLADVVVCDGFIGNVALKVSEEYSRECSRACCASLSEATVTRKLGYVLSRRKLAGF